MIYVSIASYRDPELAATIKSVVGKAAYPEQIRIGVCQQDESLNWIYGNDHVEVRHYSPEESEGVGWARSISESMYEGWEVYFLQIDSHTEMERGWDSALINQCQRASKLTKRPVVFAAYPTPYTMIDGVRDLPPHPKGACYTKPKFENGLVVGEGAYADFTEPRPAQYLNGGFMFGSGSFLKKVPSDPQIYFWGEEISRTVRAYTHGFDLFHPTIPMCWHHYRAPLKRHWNTEDESHRRVKWHVRDATSKHRVIEQCCGIMMDSHSIGSVRTVKDFEKYAGINFSDQTIRPEGGKAATPRLSSQPKPRFFGSRMPGRR